MLLPPTNTRVTFADGGLHDTSTVLAVVPRNDGNPGEAWVIVEQSPFHPVDHRWPDQPGDVGVLTTDGEHFTVAGCHIGAAAVGSEDLLADKEIPVARGTDGWRWFVLHAVQAAPENLTGRQVELRVDAGRRRELSAGHTACHVAALALNQALAGHWRKPVAVDGLGHPDFDSTAMVSSHIHPSASTDVYRLGKSLRKKGFNADAVRDDLAGVQAGVDDILAGWLATDALVRVSSDSTDLAARREWSCVLPAGTPTIACGGTHLSSLGEFGSITVELEIGDDGAALTMHTRAVLR